MIVLVRWLDHFLRCYRGQIDVKLRSSEVTKMDEILSNVRPALILSESTYYRGLGKIFKNDLYKSLYF